MSGRAVLYSTTQQQLLDNSVYPAFFAISSSCPKLSHSASAHGGQEGFFILAIVIFNIFWAIKFVCINALTAHFFSKKKKIKLLGFVTTWTVGPWQGSQLPGNPVLAGG